MEKEKKITVQFFANNRLKPKQSVWDGRLTEVFPLYVMVIYDGNNTQFKVDINGETILVSSDLSQLSVPALKVSLQEYKKYILKVVESEIEHFGKNFSLTGLGYRCSIYSRKISGIAGKRSRQYHCLKTETEYYQAIERGVKKFELRKNDRDFQVYDIICLEETVDGIYTGRKLPPIEIKYILQGGKFGLKEGYCIMCW